MSNGPARETSSSKVRNILTAVKRFFRRVFDFPSGWSSGTPRVPVKPKRPRLQLGTLEERNPPSEALGSLGLPVFMSGLSLLGWEGVNPVATEPPGAAHGDWLVPLAPTENDPAPQLALPADAGPEDAPGRGDSFESFVPAPLGGWASFSFDGTDLFDMGAGDGSALSSGGGSPEIAPLAASATNGSGDPGPGMTGSGSPPSFGSSGSGSEFGSPSSSPSTASTPAVSVTDSGVGDSSGEESGGNPGGTVASFGPGGEGNGSGEGGTSGNGGGTGGGSSSAWSPLGATPQVMTIDWAEGSLLTGVVASYTPEVSTATDPALYRAKVNWGDGTVTDVPAGSITWNAATNQLDIAAEHRYAEEGLYSRTVILRTPVATDPTGTLVYGERVLQGGQVRVTDAVLSPEVAAAPTVAEGELWTGAVGRFRDANALSKATDFTATIVWEDLSTSRGQVVGLGGGLYEVKGEHRFVQAGVAAVRIDVQDIGGSQVSVYPTVVVTDAEITGEVVTSKAVRGTKFSGVTARFTDANGYSKPEDFEATIDWGDGFTSSGQGVKVVDFGAGHYEVQGDHTYQTLGSKSVEVTFKDKATLQTETVTSTIDVAFEIDEEGRAIEPHENQEWEGVVASFTLEEEPTSNWEEEYTVRINWGDGTAWTLAELEWNAAEMAVEVSGTHTYLEDGAYQIVVTVFHPDGTTSEIKSTAVVVAAPIVVELYDIQPYEGINFNGGVGKIVAPDLSTLTPFLPSRYTAMIDWGNGRVAEAKLEAIADGSLEIRGTIVYAKEGPYQLKVTVREKGNSFKVEKRNISVREPHLGVHDLPLHPIARDDSWFAPSRIDGAVASFAQYEFPELSSIYPTVPSNEFDESGEFSSTIDWGDGTVEPGTIYKRGQILPYDHNLNVHPFWPGGSEMSEPPLQHIIRALGAW